MYFIYNYRKQLLIYYCIRILKLCLALSESEPQSKSEASSSQGLLFNRTSQSPYLLPLLQPPLPSSLRPLPAATAATADATADATATAAAADVGDQLFNRFGCQELGKQVRPVRLDGDTGALDDGVDLVLGDFLAIIVQDEGSVSACKFSRL